MKGSQRKQKALAVAVFGIYLAGLLCYSLRNEDTVSTGQPRPSSGRPVSKRPISSSDPRGAFSFRTNPHQVPSGFEYQTFSPEARSHTARETGAPVFDDHSIPFLSLNRLNQHADGSITAPNVSGTSENPAELVQEIMATSNSKEEVFEKLCNLTYRHSDAKIREQAVTYLAEVNNDLAINYVIEALVDPEARVRQRALEALYKLGDRVPIESLVDLAAHRGDAEMRAQIAAFVQQFADPTQISQRRGDFTNEKEERTKHEFSQSRKRGNQHE